MNKYRGKISNIKLNKRLYLRCVWGGGSEYINVKLQSTKVNCHFSERGRFERSYMTGKYIYMFNEIYVSNIYIQVMRTLLSSPHQYDKLSYLGTQFYHLLKDHVSQIYHVFHVCRLKRHREKEINIFTLLKSKFYTFFNRLLYDI